MYGSKWEGKATHVQYEITVRVQIKEWLQEREKSREKFSTVFCLNKKKVELLLEWQERHRENGQWKLAYKTQRNFWRNTIQESAKQSAKLFLEKGMWKVNVF